MSPVKPIIVTSHISRDFIQNAAYFNTVPKIVWEYVANSLDNSKDDVPAVVVVEVTSKFISISDNGIGMLREDLENFFRMHGENIQRKKGKRVRGRFGTGKSAAFGLANCLRIDTTKNGQRNVVELKRSDIENAKGGEPFPVQDIIVNEKTELDDGTTIEIREIELRNLDVDNTISYIERHLSRYRQRAHVTINGHECKFEEAIFIEKFEYFPPPEVAQHIGKIPLIIKVSPTPLDDEIKGIDILSYGIWHGTTLAGVEKKERSNYIFGQIDVPLLEEGEWPVPPFDNTRNNTLNPQNPIVAMLLAWISQELEKVRQHIIEKERERKKSDESKQLAKEAEKIAEILNDDFVQQEMELELTQRVTKRSGDKSVNEILDQQGNLWPGQGNDPTSWEQTGAPHGSGKRGKLGGEGNIQRPGPNVQTGNEPGARKSTTDGNQKKRRAVFTIDYENASVRSYRSRYDRETKTIFINLDHPQIASAYESGGKRTDSRQFRETCYEIAAVEYAIALPYEKYEKNQLYDASEALYEVKETINRITQRFMKLL